MPIYALGHQEPEIHPDAYVHPDAVVIGSVTIGARSSVWPGAVLRGDDGEIHVGEDSSVQDGAVLHTTPMWATVLGNHVTVGHNAHLEACTVEDKALIGSGSIVLHNAQIGREAVVGAGAFVGNNKVVPPLAMALGVPATIKPDAVEPGHFDFGVLSYVHRAERYREELRRLPDHDTAG
ncbi:MAG: gamma carbonic anhydrase family protein [Actinomycetia bacterium]|nr:gamma carbonic anhydrase family protein [Actinomycetes bacterium]